MPSKLPELYSVYKTTIWFAIASILLLGCLVVMVFQDSAREWKHYQRQYMEYSRQMAEAELKAAEHAVDAKELESLKQQLEAAQKSVEAQQSEIAKIEEALVPIDLEITKTKKDYQNLKQHQDSEQYFFEEHRMHKEEEKAKKYEESLAKRAVIINEKAMALERLEKQREDLQNQITEITGAEKQLNLELRRLNGEVTRIESKIAKLTPDWRSDILNAPMLDFIKPGLQIQQIVLEDLHDDYYFAQVNKVDRCITCHLGIDQEGFKDAPKPFKAHPRLDIFVGADSPHPMEEFGCTSCHGGSGHSVSFKTAAHMPQTEEQGKEWKKKYHWKPMKHWADKMLPLQHVEASCAKCHTGTVKVPEADRLNEGRELARTYGCFGCHKVEGFEDTWNAGPSLENIGSKVESDWIVRWLHNPKEFRPSTTMPQVFHLSNTSDEEGKDKSNASIAGIAAYLMKHSGSVTLEGPKVEGDVERGQALVKEIGCMGCHGVEGVQVNIHGPELSGLGSKVTAEWLYTWLKNPKHYDETTQMPDMRLTDQEAADITAYLLKDKNDKFESIRPPLVKPEVVDELALHYMTGNMRHEQAKAELEKMSSEDRLEFIGKKSIAHQGCYGCHSIAGFEDANKIGVELTKEGSKDIHRFDFGFVKIPHTRKDWIYQKLKEPRIFDKGKDKPYHDRLRMPHFGFSDDQAEALTTFVLSLVGTEIPMSKKRLLSVKDKEIEEGRFLVEKMNCQGCHTMDGVEGRVRELFDDIGNAPPIIDGEGSKVQPDWLYKFLEHPTPIRPWLKYRMPTFGLSDEELKTFVRYFNHLDDVEAEFVSEKALKLDQDAIAKGHQLFDAFQCIKCHKSNPEPGLSASFLAPNLVMSKERLRPEWVVDWLVDPQAIQPGTMMPGFFPDGESPVTDVYDGDYMKQIEAMRDYMWVFEGEEKTTTPPKKEN